MNRDPVAQYGSYVVYYDPPSANRSFPRYSIWRAGKYVGATYSFPDIDACKFEERKRNEPTQFSSIRDIPSHRYQITQHRTPANNRAVRIAALQSPISTLVRSNAEVDA